MEVLLAEDAWRTFAEANHLAFVPAFFLSGDVDASGEYRGHSLTVELRTDSNQATFFRAVLHPDRSGESAAVGGEKLVEPTPRNVLATLLPSGFLFLPGKLEAESGGRQVSYEEGDFLREPAQLKRIADLLSDLAEGYPAVVAAGGAVAPTLQIIAREEDLLRNVAVRMLEDIAQATQHLGGQAGQLLCPRCLVRCHAHRADLPWQPDVTYYGCRACHQSQEFIDCPKGVVAVLDAAGRGVQERQLGFLRINWLVRRVLFDFDRVEIIRATDEDVERFAMQVGNDTDPFRKARYGQTRCSLAPNCHLAENTLRILESLFGQVDA